VNCTSWFQWKQHFSALSIESFYEISVAEGAKYSKPENISFEVQQANTKNVNNATYRYALSAILNSHDKKG